MLAIVALLAGRVLGWVWLDPAMGIVGAIVIAHWSWTLMRDTAAVLLDAADPRLEAEVREHVEKPGDARITDLHVWRVGPGAHAGIVSVSGKIDGETVRRRVRADKPARFRERVRGAHRDGGSDRARRGGSRHHAEPGKPRDDAARWHLRVRGIRAAALHPAAVAHLSELRLLPSPHSIPQLWRRLSTRMALWERQMNPEEFRNLYIRFMEEIKNRIWIVSELMSGKIIFPNIIIYEFCFLQFRMICETIALGCLAAHGDLPETQSKALLKAYKPRDIVIRLEALHPKFYPLPTRQILDPATGKVIATENVTEPYLTKECLLKLYDECGDVLHRGSMKQILRPEMDIEFEIINFWAKRITRLLDHHQINLINPDFDFWVMMHCKDDGRVQGFLMQNITSQDT